MHITLSWKLCTPQCLWFIPLSPSPPPYMGKRRTYKLPDSVPLFSINTFPFHPPGTRASKNAKQSADSVSNLQLISKVNAGLIELKGRLLCVSWENIVMISLLERCHHKIQRQKDGRWQQMTGRQASTTCGNTGVVSVIISCIQYIYLHTLW